MVGAHHRQGGARHARLEGVGRVLHDDRAAAVLDGVQARAAVFEHAGEHHADGARAHLQRGGTKQGVDGGACMVFLRAAGQADHTAFEQHVVVGRRDVDGAGGRRIAIVRRHGGVGPARAQELRELAAVRADVLHEEYRHRKVRGQRRRELEHRVHAARRGTNEDGARRSAGWGQRFFVVRCHGREREVGGWPRAREQALEVLRVDGLHEIVGRAQAHVANRGLQAGLAGHEHQHGVAQSLVLLVEQREAVAVGQVQVDQEQVGPLHHHQPARCSKGIRAHHRMPLPRDERGHHASRVFRTGGDAPASGRVRAGLTRTPSIARCHTRFAVSGERSSLTWTRCPWQRQSRLADGNACPRRFPFQELPRPFRDP
ncbi:hypothetical protein J2W28_002837 [Variovorax boronicumulans]|nr:hypothetical protein [Variovorax boronicumulans]MDQ0003688.1 hypothetical protein [Variovorax boronicumulans]